ncbi:MAG: glutamate mutase L [Fusobacteriaceae bacterium]|nr:glutamate mutase L [Fusobacteriaceae bacterium]MBP6322546.1 glutamate mutase L [Fusobacteriaceae bacterium]MBP9509589.1 glutamate mutase L [Fusobacteriaceae bacterium]
MELEYLVAEIGSTTTVVNAFVKCSEKKLRFIGQGQAATTVLEGDVNIGLENAILNLKSVLKCDEINYKEMLATSSAAGGLKMTVHGLVYDMTVKAAREAALGAGANLHFITAGKISRFDLKKIVDVKPNIILIAGGVDFGEKETALYNAEKIAELPIEVPVLYAGNIACQDEVKFIFEEAGKGHLIDVTDNVYPKIDELNVEPVRKKIQKIFEENITHAPGMNSIRKMVKGHIMPTPGAVMEATKVLYEKIGDIVTIDVGGATTDVSSVTEGSEAINLILQEPEPISKRTVEGDLGCYVSKKNVIELLGIEKMAKALDISVEEASRVLEELPPIPKTELQLRVAEYITKEAVTTSLYRHAGNVKITFASGSKRIAMGKDLTMVRYIVGTGGALTRLPKRIEILESILKSNHGEKLLPTDSAKILIDNHYIMASIGVLSLNDKEIALNLLEESFNGIAL